jgi:hypothetical protein
MSWRRALATGVVIVVAAAILLVCAPDFVLIRLTGIGRSGRVAIAPCGSSWCSSFWRGPCGVSRLTGGI